MNNDGQEPKLSDGPNKYKNFYGVVKYLNNLLSTRELLTVCIFNIQM